MCASLTVCLSAARVFVVLVPLVLGSYCLVSAGGLLTLEYLLKACLTRAILAGIRFLNRPLSDDCGVSGFRIRA